MVIKRLCSVFSMGARTSSKLSPRIQSVCVVMCSVIDCKIFEKEFRLKKIFSAWALISFAASKSVQILTGQNCGECRYNVIHYYHSVRNLPSMQSDVEFWIAACIECNWFCRLGWHMIDFGQCNPKYFSNKILSIIKMLSNFEFALDSCNCQTCWNWKYKL